jgi:hypothetical protein
LIAACLTPIYFYSQDQRADSYDSAHDIQYKYLGSGEAYNRNPSDIGLNGRASSYVNVLVMPDKDWRDGSADYQPPQIDYVGKPVEPFDEVAPLMQRDQAPYFEAAERWTLLSYICIGGILGAPVLWFIFVILKSVTRSAKAFKGRYL